MLIFQQENISVHYQIFGNGPKTLLAFHGFSRNSNDFKLYLDVLGPQYTIIAWDLFYHGKTKIDGRCIRSFTKDQLKSILENFLLEQNITQFEVMGYSMGGRVALFLLEQFPEKITKAFLLAPDGLKTNFWNWMVTSTKTGKALYGFTIKNPGWFGQLTNMGKFLGLMPPKIDKFMALNFGTAGTRLRIYRVWKLYQNINFELKPLAQLLIKHHIQIDIIVGKKDPVVAPSVCEGFQKLLPQNSRFILLDAGHDLFKQHVLDALKGKI